MYFTDDDAKVIEVHRGDRGGRATSSSVVVTWRTNRTIVYDRVSAGTVVWKIQVQ